LLRKEEILSAEIKAHICQKQEEKENKALPLRNVDHLYFAFYLASH